MLASWKKLATKVQKSDSERLLKCELAGIAFIRVHFGPLSLFWQMTANQHLFVEQLKLQQSRVFIK